MNFIILIKYTNVQIFRKYWGGTQHTRGGGGGGGGGGHEYGN